MSTDRTTWKILDTDGAFTVVEVPVEPGQVMQVPIRTALLHTPAAEIIVNNLLTDHAIRRDQLREPL